MRNLLKQPTITRADSDAARIIVLSLVAFGEQLQAVQILSVTCCYGSALRCGDQRE